jgi:hypothetical protein
LCHPRGSPHYLGNKSGNKTMPNTLLGRVV